MDFPNYFILSWNLFFTYLTNLILNCDLAFVNIPNIKPYKIISIYLP